LKVRSDQTNKLLLVIAYYTIINLKAQVIELIPKELDEPYDNYHVPIHVNGDGWSENFSKNDTSNIWLILMALSFYFSNINLQIQ